MPQLPQAAAALPLGVCLPLLRGACLPPRAQRSWGATAAAYLRGCWAPAFGGAFLAQAAAEEEEEAWDPLSSCSATTFSMGKQPSMPC